VAGRVKSRTFGPFSQKLLKIYQKIDPIRVVLCGVHDLPVTGGLKICLKSSNLEKNQKVFKKIFSFSMFGRF